MTEDWPKISALGVFRPIAGNSTTILAGNETFFKGHGSKALARRGRDRAAGTAHAPTLAKPFIGEPSENRDHA